MHRWSPRGRRVHIARALAVAVTAGLLALGATQAPGRERADSAEPAGGAPSASGLRLRATPKSATRWKVQIENRGSDKIELALDPYLLTLEPITQTSEAETTSRKKRTKRDKPVVCRLPGSMLPAAQSVTRGTLRPGERASFWIDPRLFCFGARPSAVLDSAEHVVLHYGFPPPGRKRAPDAIGRVIGGGAQTTDAGPDAITVLDSGRIALPKKAVDAGTATADAGAKSSGPPSAFRVVGRAYMDVVDGDGIDTSITLRNTSKTKARVVFRPTTLGFDVKAPHGRRTHCEPASGTVEIPELVRTIGPGRSVSAWVRLDAFCPGRTFDQPGLYAVQPSYVLPAGAGASLGAPLTHGPVTSGTMLVRVRRSTTKRIIDTIEIDRFR